MEKKGYMLPNVFSRKEIIKIRTEVKEIENKEKSGAGHGASHL
jgi:hypothetical protein